MYSSRVGEAAPELEVTTRTSLEEIAEYVTYPHSDPRLGSLVGKLGAKRMTI